MSLVLATGIVVSSFGIAEGAFPLDRGRESQLNPQQYAFSMTYRYGGTGEQTGGHSWYQRVVNLLQYEKQDGDGLFDVTFGTGGNWLSRAGANPPAYRVNDPKGVCDCPNMQCCAQYPGKEENCGTDLQTFEGGTQYMSGLSARTPKWRVGDSVGCYNAFTQCPMFHSQDYKPHSCSWADRTTESSSMGLVQLSNRLMLLPDGQTFEKDGMLGIAYVRTPFGKTNANDIRNFWTLIMHSENYAGPVAYFLPEFWSLRAKSAHGTTDDFPDYSNVPRISATGSGPAWEAHNSKKFVDGDVTKLLKMSMPQVNGRTVLWMGGRGHNTSDIIDPLEHALATGHLDPSKVLAGGVPPGQNTLHPSYNMTSMNYGCDHETKDIAFGKEATWGTSKSTYENGDCVMAVKVANSSCPRNGPCDLPRYYDKSTGKPVDASKASENLKNARFPMKQRDNQAYDALNNAPVGGCRDSPGPANQKLYCAKTIDGLWLGYRWYKFVDQPAMKQLNLNAQQRDFMQQRVTKLHKMIPTPVSKWINGRHAEAEGLARTDPAAIATPPKGLDEGYVPIILYQGEQKPPECGGKPTPPAPTPPPSDPHCDQKCKAAGHCCTGATSSDQHPSCAMGCAIAKHTGSASGCKATCNKNDNTCNWNLGGIPQYNCGSCPGGCGYPKVQDCLDGCEFGFPASCEDSCAKAGHYCVGATSSFQHPSCAMGCTIAKHTGSVSDCEATCRKNDNTCDWSIAGIPQNNCGSCPKGNPSGVSGCLAGCKFGFGSSMSVRDNWNGSTGLIFGPATVPFFMSL